MYKKLKATATVRWYRSGKTEVVETFMVLIEGESPADCLQARWGCFADILESAFEPVDIFVSDRYCYQAVIGLLEYESKVR